MKTPTLILLLLSPLLLVAQPSELSQKITDADETIQSKLLDVSTHLPSQEACNGGNTATLRTQTLTNAEPLFTAIYGELDALKNHITPLYDNSTDEDEQEKYNNLLIVIAVKRESLEKQWEDWEEHLQGKMCTDKMSRFSFFFDLQYDPEVEEILSALTP